MHTHAISLRLINHGADCAWPIVIFRRVAATGTDEPLAWLELGGLASGAAHALSYDLPAPGDGESTHAVPTIWIAVFETTDRKPWILPDARTELTLQGISAADIVMTGGPVFQFALANIKYPL
ncbi:MAG TPA: hypothetical protein VFP84_08905 [Kofleriaceae bacterium]|nr:hypothetical protein [Kofleriaceae bacterium]